MTRDIHGDTAIRWSVGTRGAAEASHAALSSSITLTTCLIVLKVVSIDLEMDTPERVEAYLAGQPEPKQTDLRQLHARMLADFPECRLWFDDGTNEDGKVVSNPNIGYGRYTITYANGSSREFYRIGLSATTTGISVYVLGLDDKTYLPRTVGTSIGAASVTGYCIKFKRLSVINAETLHAAIRHGMTVDQNG